MAINKITVIGAGSVGATTAYTLAIKNMANEIVLIDIREEKASGEAMDIHQGTPLLSDPMHVYSGGYEASAGSDFVVITSGMPRKPGQTRLDLTRTNVGIIKEIAPQVVKYCPDATYIIVSNPVDILTYVFAKISGVPENRIIGSGTLLDTARLRARIAEDLNVSQKNVHAYVFGEHGDSSFIPWSVAEVSTIPVEDYKTSIHLDNGPTPHLDYDDVDNYVRKSGATIIANKGCTNYAIAISVTSIIDSLDGSVNTVGTVSTMLHGEYGIDDVCLSIPVLLGRGKVQGHILPKLTLPELDKLTVSADALKTIISQLDL